MTDKNISFKLKIILMQVFIFFLFYMSYSEKIAKLPQVMKPFFITIGQDRLYISEENYKVHIYELKNNKAVFKKTFGKKGQGPGEIDFVSHITVKDNYLEIPTWGKYARFTLDGQFIDELKLPFRVFKDAIYKVGENYVSRDRKPSMKTLDEIINLWNPDLSLIKEIGKTRKKRDPKRFNIVGDYYSFTVSDNNIYTIKTGKKTIVKKYNKNGKFLEEIILPLSQIKVDNILQKKIEDELSVQFSSFRWKSIKKQFYLSPTTSSLNHFRIYDNKMIARTFRYKGKDKIEFVFFDMNGNELKRIYLYNTGRSSANMNFCFYKNDYYYIKENADDEIWELFSVKVF